MNKLTIALVLVALTVYVQAGEEGSPEVKAAIESCKTKFPNVKDNVIKEMCTPGFKTDDMEVKCFGKCMGEVLGYTDASGKIVADKLKAKPPHGIEAGQIDSIVQECGSKVGADACDTAYQQWICLMGKKKM